MLEILPSGRVAYIHVKATSAWDSRPAILRTRFAGPCGIAEVVSWRAGLYSAVATVPRFSSFKLLVDLRGYDVAAMDPSVHKVQRGVIPIFLSSYHFHSGFIDFFGLKYDSVRHGEEIHCVGVAYVHNEGPKLDLYRKTLSREDENFFSSLSEAESWIAALPFPIHPVVRQPG